MSLPNSLPKNAVGAIRVSTTKQGIDGDSPEDQRLQIERAAAQKGLDVTKFFLFLESASKEQQPMQEAIDYCKDPKNNVQCFMIKSIDRFTRGGATFYDNLKVQLDDAGVDLIDLHGVISNQKINTLDHLGVEYKWSVFSPSKKAEMLEAERAKDEVRDIQTRMIGAQIRYARMGYWVRKSLYGFNNVHIETNEGKRCILKPNKQESLFVLRMFEMRARNILDDQEIVNELNRLGFRTRKRLVRDKQDRTKIVNVLGDEPLTLKMMWRILENPVYAGVNPEKWTQDKPVKCRFKGLVSYELFNAANRGKIIITENAESVQIHRRRPPEHLLNKGARNMDFPYKRIVMCPECRKPLLGSASRGKLGKYYPAYHCNKRGHYFRKPNKEFMATLTAFVKSIQVRPEYLEQLRDFVDDAYAKQQVEIHDDAVTLDLRLEQLRSQIRQAVDKIKFLSSETSIKYMEEDIAKLEAEIKDVELERAKCEPQTAIDIDKYKAYVTYYMEHLEELLLNHSSPIQKAKYFGLIFNEAPTYQDLVDGTPDCTKLTGVNEVFKSKKFSSNLLAERMGLDNTLQG